MLGISPVRSARLALVGLLAAVAGCGDVPSVLGESHTLEVAPGAWVEAELAMAIGDTAGVDFDAGDVELAWDVHAHEAGLVVTYQEGVDSRYVIEHEAPETRLYWVLWTNSTDAAATMDVSFRFGGSAALTAWYP